MAGRAGDARASMDVFDAVRTLLAVRSYQNKPIPDAVVRRIVEAGRLRTVFPCLSRAARAHTGRTGTRRSTREASDGRS